MDDMKMRVIYFVRCSGEPNGNTEDAIMARISNAVATEGDCVLTIGRQYYHNVPLCGGHAEVQPDFCDYYVKGSPNNDR